MEKVQKKSLWKALLFSFLICLAGSVVWGLVYSIGFMVYAVALATAIFAGMIFTKYYKFNILSFFWIVLLSFLLNLVAILFALNLQIVNEIIPEYSFARGMDVLFELIRTNAEVKSAFVGDILFNAFAVIIGASIVWINITVQKKKSSTQPNAVANIDSNLNKGNIKPSEENEKIDLMSNVTENTKDLNSINNVDAFTRYYTLMIRDFTLVIDEFKANKDRDNFKTKINELKTKYFSKLQPASKDKLCEKINNDLTLSNSKDEQLVLNTILKLL